MPFVAAKCKQCGHNMQVDESLEKGFCPACGTPYMKEDVVNNYNTYNTTNYQIEHADVVISDNGSIEKWLENAEVFLTVHHDYDKAKELFKRVTDDAPADYRGWWGMVRTLTFDLCVEDFFNYVNSYSDLSQKYKFADGREEEWWIRKIPPYIETFVERAINVASGKHQIRIKDEWKAFSKEYDAFSKKKFDEVKTNHENDRINEVNKLQSEADSTLDRISELNQEANRYRNQIEKNNNNAKKIGIICVVICIGSFLLSRLWNPIIFVGEFLLAAGFIYIVYFAIKTEFMIKTKRDYESDRLWQKIKECREQSKQLQDKYQELQTKIDELSRNRN